MTTDTFTQFSLTEFQKDLSSSDQRKLLRWADCELYTALVRNAAGHEEPVVIQIDEKSRYAASTSADTLHNLLASAKLEEGSEAVIKPLPLAELARNAHLYGVGLHIVDDGEGDYIAGRTTLVLGMKAVVETPENKKVLYEAEIFFFKPTNDVHMLPYGSVQYWYDANPKHTYTSDESQAASIYVFDDQLDWSNPLFPDLPEGAMPLSTLSPSAQAFFERTRLPLLQRWNDAPAEPIEPELLYHNSLIGEPLLSFSQLRAMVDQDIVPAANDIILKVAKTVQLEGEPADASERWEVKVSFTTPIGIKALFDLDWVQASLCQANTELPNTIGTHSASEALRERIVNHLAWVFLQRGRSFDVARFGECLDGLFPDQVINSDKAYQPDYTDRRFPCLARFQCGEYPVPVMLLG